VLSRYLEEVVAIQCLVLGPDPYPAPEVTHVTSGGLVSLVPILHGLVLVAALEAMALAFQATDLVNMFTRFVCIAPFIGASIFIVSNEAYIVQFKARIAGQSQGEIAKRRQSARVFALASVVSGAASLLFLVFVQAQLNVT
jgi:hypothetical protein